MSRWARGAAVAGAVSLLLASRTARARECAFWSGNGPSVYGLSNGLTEAYAGSVDQAGLGGLRVNFRIDTETTWDAALFAQYDAYMAVAKEHGLDVLGIVLYESTTEGQADWNSGYDATGYSPYVQLFVDTTKTLMERYGDQVKYWEIWNEPNAWTQSDYATNPTNAGGTYILPLVYSKMLAEVFVQANATITSKGLHLVAGGLFAHDIGGSFSPATDYASQLYSLGPWDWMQANYGRRYPWDAFGYHIYIDQGGATSSAHIQEYLGAVESLMAAQSDGAPIWITEFGWQSPSAISDAQQASNIDTALATFEADTHVGRTFVFKVDDYDDWGLFDAAWNPKPSVTTYTTHDDGCTHLPTGGADAGGDAAADGARPDAGRDAAVGRDAAEAPRDAATDGRGSGRGEAAAPTSGGCGCRAGGTGRTGGVPGGEASAGLAVAAVLRRRRHRHGRGWRDGR